MFLISLEIVKFIYQYSTLHSKVTLKRCVTMGIFDIFKRKDKRNNHTFDETDREFALETRRLNQESKRIQAEMNLLRQQMALEEQKQKLEELKSNMFEEDDDEEPEPTDNFEKILLALLSSSQGINKNPITQRETQPDNTSKETSKGVSLSDEKLEEIWSKVPLKTKAMTKFMSEDKIRIYLKNNFNDIDNDTIERAIKIIKKK